MSLAKYFRIPMVLYSADLSIIFQNKAAFQTIYHSHSPAGTLSRIEFYQVLKNLHIYPDMLAFNDIQKIMAKKAPLQADSLSISFNQFCHLFKDIANCVFNKVKSVCKRINLLLCHINNAAIKQYQCTFKVEMGRDINQLKSRQFQRVSHKKPSIGKRDIHITISEYSDTHGNNSSSHSREHSFDSPDSRHSSRKVPNATFQALKIYRSSSNNMKPVTAVQGKKDKKQDKKSIKLNPNSILCYHKSRESSATKNLTYSQTDLTSQTQPRHLSAIPIQRDTSLSSQAKTIDGVPVVTSAVIRKCRPNTLKEHRSISSNSDVIIEEKLNESTESLKKVTRIRSKHFKSSIDSRSQSRDKVTLDVSNATIDLSNVSKKPDLPKKKLAAEEVVRHMCKLFHKFEDAHNEIINKHKAHKKNTKIFNTITIYTQNAISNNIQIYSDSEQSNSNSRENLNKDKDSIIKDLKAKVRLLEMKNEGLEAELRSLKATSGK